MKKMEQYQQWIRENENRERIGALGYEPLFSVFVFENEMNKHEQKAIKRTIKKQTYRNWELIEISEQQENGLWNRVHGEFVLFLFGKERLAVTALQEMVQFLNQCDAYDIIYSDEDCINKGGKKRANPFFKPDWSPDLFRCMPYVNQLTIYRKDLAEKIWENMDKTLEEAGLAWMYDFQLRFTEQITAERIGHISRILCHIEEADVANLQTETSKMLEELRIVKREALKRQGRKGYPEKIEGTQETRVVYECENNPLVSIIIPSKDHVEMLFRCLDSIEQNSSYPNYEIILVDNGSSEENRKQIEQGIQGKRIRYCYEKMEFNFSRMCNMGAQNADGEYLLFLNDDIEIIQTDWMERMVGHGMQADSGAIGAKLLYPDSDLIQHAGVANLKMGPSHYLIGQTDKDSYYFGRNRLEYNCLAVTGACLLVKKEKCNRVGGFDEELIVAYNDVDLCFRLYEAGYYNVVRNDVKLYHYESVSRGLDVLDANKMKRLKRERSMLWSKHPTLAETDPFYSEHLTQDYTDFRLHLKRDSLEESKCLGDLKRTKQIEGEFTCYIDTLQVDEQVVINGWYYWRNDKCTRNCNAYLVLRDEKQNCICYETCLREREDVAKVMGNQVVECGFSCRIPSEKLELETTSYQIGVMLKMPKSGRKVLGWTEHLLIHEKNVTI